MQGRTRYGNLRTAEKPREHTINENKVGAPIPVLDRMLRGRKYLPIKDNGVICGPLDGWMSFMRVHVVITCICKVVFHSSFFSSLLCEVIDIGLLAREPGSLGFNSIFFNVWTYDRGIWT
jgi:hypothetical protein